jgi:hypothetical protein
MRVFTYTEARQKLAEVLDIALTEEVMIKRKNGDFFLLVYKKQKESPFDVPGIKTKATTEDILSVVRDSRSKT